MQDWLDLERYPLDRLDSAAGRALVAACQQDLDRTGMFTLPGFVHPRVADHAAEALSQPFAQDAFLHARRHNIYFRKDLTGMAPDHPALREMTTSNRTLCADQVPNNPLLTIYDWPPLAAFLAATMGMTALYPMADPLARVNVMSYDDGQALNWHFDRSEFTTTLLLQAPESGGVFEYRRDLRSDTDPNLDGVAALLDGRDPELRRLDLAPGALNVFRGRNTAHRVTPVVGDVARIIAVFSYYDRPGVYFSKTERQGFYGRAD